MLNENGLFVLEAHTCEAIRNIGTAPASGLRRTHGLFSEKPHLCLQENFWNVVDSSALSGYFIVDAASAEVQRYASFMQAYTATEYEEMLRAAKLPIQRILDETTWPSGDEFIEKLQVFACRKRGASTVR